MSLSEAGKRLVRFIILWPSLVIILVVLICCVIDWALDKDNPFESFDGLISELIYMATFGIWGRS